MPKLDPEERVLEIVSDAEPPQLRYKVFLLRSLKDGSFSMQIPIAITDDGEAIIPFEESYGTMEDASLAITEALSNTGAQIPIKYNQLVIMGVVR